MDIEKLVICIDFDGTCTTHEYPLIGDDIGAVPVLRKLVGIGHKLILYTMRSGKELDDAVNWFKEKDIPLYGIQTNPTQKKWTTSPKCYGQLYIDDAALGCPLKQNYQWKPILKGLFDPSEFNKNSVEIPVGRPFVDWNRVEEMLVLNRII